MRAGFFGKLLDRIRHVEASVNDLDRRQNNFLREGRVVEVDYEKGLFKIDANGLKSKWVPMATRSGTIRDWSPPAIGERVMLVSPTGEPGQGVLLPGGYSDQFPQPHNQGGQHRRSIGEYSITESGEGVTIKVGPVTFAITAAGVDITGGRVTSNGKRIDSTHTHGGVVPGGGNSSTPN